jgi:hypothetical protein
MTRAVHLPCGPIFDCSLTALMLESNLSILISRIRNQTSEPQIKKGAARPLSLFGGERGIRTLDTVLPYTHFPGVLLQPLGHLSGKNKYRPHCRWRQVAVCKGGARVNQMALKCNSASHHPGQTKPIYMVYLRLARGGQRRSLIIGGCGSSVSNSIRSAIAGFM